MNLSLNSLFHWATYHLSALYFHKIQPSWLHNVKASLLLHHTTNNYKYKSHAKVNSRMDSAPELADPERAHLITQIINSIGRTRLVNAAGWAALWFADIEVLRSYAQGDTWLIAELLSTESKTLPRLLLDCMLLLIPRLLYELADNFCRERRANIRRTKHPTWGEYKEEKDINNGTREKVRNTFSSACRVW